jgi:hypothetical protein
MTGCFGKCFYLKEELTVRRWILRTEDLYNWYFTPSIIMVIKSEVEILLENVACKGEMRSACRIMVRNFRVNTTWKTQE